MPRPSKRRRYLLEEEQSQSQAQGLGGVQAPEAEEEEASSSSTCSSSFPSSSSSSCYPLFSSTPEEMSAPGTPSPSQSPRGACPATAAAASALESPAQEVSAAGQGEERPSTSAQAMQAAAATSKDAVDDEKVADLVQFLLLKFRTQEPTSQAEMLREILGGDEEHFPDIFSHACECMQLVFGLDVKEVDPQDHSYVLVNTLGLSYDAMLCVGQNVPKTGILVLILSIIFIEGNSAPEEEIWGALEVMGVFAGVEHFIFGEPRELLTEVWVQERYLEYRQVPGSDPARYEFLWGPRAHTETTKMKVLEFLARVNGSDPRSFPLWYEEALRDQEVRAQTSIASPPDDSAGMAGASSSAGASPCAGAISSASARARSSARASSSAGASGFSWPQ